MNVMQRRFTESDILEAKNMDSDLLLHCELSKPYITHEDVRIYPGTLVMANAFDMKQFDETFVVKNYGKYTANVRIFAPKSTNFVIQAITGKGVNLAPGMEIVRTVKHLYRSQTSLSHVSFRIQINGFIINYQVIITIPQAIVDVCTTKLELGTIDVGKTSKQTITLTNTGHQQGTFCVDALMKSDIYINVTPKKGFIEAMKNVRLDVEITGNKAGYYRREFWIKTEPKPLRIRFTVEIIIPELLPVHPITNYEITIIEFPKCYIGSSYLKTLVIKNQSSLPSMFCGLAELEHDLMDIQDAYKIDQNYKFFSIMSQSGRLPPNGSSIIQIKFTPLKTKTVIEVSEPSKYLPIYLTKTFSIALFYQETEHPVVKEFLMDEQLETQMSDVKSDEPVAKKFIRVCLYGEIEVAKMKIRPESINLRGNIGETYNHELHLKNESLYLPIYYSYEKAPYMEAYPKSGRIKAGEAIEITLKMRPYEIGVHNIKVVFKLMYPNELNPKNMDTVGESSLEVNMTGIYVHKETVNKYVTGITPFVANEVGYINKNITFATKNECPPLSTVTKSIPKGADESDLVALPNDTQQSVKPWRNTTRCATLFSNLPRHITPDDQYNLTEHEKDLRDKNNTYYVDFIRSCRRIMAPKVEFVDYDLTNKKHLLLKHMKCLQQCSERPLVKKMSAFIPLTSEKLNNIKIIPQVIELGKIPALSSTSDIFRIENKNDFDIFLLIKPCKACITVTENYLIIKANSNQIIRFRLTGNDIGHFTGTIAILVNSCHIFEFLITAQIISPGLSCDEHDITMSPEKNIYFIKVKNPVDVFVEFNWNLSETTTFNIYPKQGMFPPKRDMLFVLRYKPKVEQGNNVEVILVAQNEEKNIFVKHQEKKVEYQFSKNHVDFGKMPLNVLIVKELFLKNNNDNSMSFVVENPKQIHGVQIKPSKGIIKANSMRLFHINAKFREVFDFVTNFNFIFDQGVTHSVKVTGSVIYPNIKINPDKIHIPKIVPEAMIRYEFSLKNKSVTNATVKFLMDAISEFNVKDSIGNKIKLVSLMPGETTYLFLEFAPKEAVAYGVYLPLLINYIFGPSESGVRETFLPKTFLCHREHIEGITPAKIPSKLPTLNISCAAGSHLVTFSSLKFEFSQNVDCSPQEFIIKNVSDQKIRLIINQESLDEPFSMLYVNGPIPRDYDNTQLLRLRPGEEAIYSIAFKTDAYGVYTIELPIYIKEYYNNCVFNYLQLYGEYLQPTITPSNPIIYFDVIIPKIITEENVSLKLNMHLAWCEMDVQCNIPEITVNICDEDENDPQEKNVTISFHPNTVLVINDSITFSCTCGSECKLVIRAVSAISVMTAYKNYFRFTENNSNINLDSASEDFVTLTSQYLGGNADNFPNFPMLDTKDNIGLKVIQTLTIVESWLYTQGFFCKEYFKLPYNISIYSPFSEEDEDKKKKKKKDNVQKKLLPVQKLLVNLTDQSILKYVSSDVEVNESDPDSEATACYSTYKNLIKFLLSNAMMTTHIHPELLLSYQQYVFFKENINDPDADEGEVLVEENFYSLSTQAWFDLIMQIFKMFALSKVKRKIVQNEINFYLDEQYFEYYNKHILTLVECNNDEKALLLWMEFIFNTNCGKLSQKLKQRTIRNFIHDLKDGIVLAVILMTYCPYMKYTLVNIIIEGNSEETRINNACVVVQVFEALKLSIDVDPLAIVYPNPCEMVIIASYLYDVLPYFHPNEQIEIEGVVGGTGSKELLIQNPGDVPICYRGIFIPESTLFEVQPAELVIPPKKTKSINIIFKSTNVLKTKLTLILSGETPKYKYAKSMTYTVIGIPTFNTDKIIKIKVPIYTPVHKKISITSPYKDYICKLFACPNMPPESLDDFVTWKDWDALKIPRQVSSEHSEVKFNSEGQCKIMLDLCFIIPGKHDFFIFFLHEMGDFCYNIKINVVSKSMSDQIHVDMPNSFFNSDCVCKDGNIRENCAKTLMVNIPYKNKLLWNGLMMLIRTSRPQDESFWKKYLGTCKRGVFRKHREFSFFETNIYLFVYINVVAFKIVPIGYYTHVPALLPILETLGIGKNQTEIYLANMEAGASLQYCFWPKILFKI
ncbi:unnamed protein product [Brassicogethes aeneus]|uniref:Calponin-homology (CH) domain-containing protein n=1 Tax=Brassicogethes aeneus TaxID=1431903 RepID=A0A9P0FI73_BRAAE|nr:unnamed protein product [Brassicogethes aeneus]